MDSEFSFIIDTDPENNEDSNTSGGDSSSDGCMGPPLSRPSTSKSSKKGLSSFSNKETELFKDFLKFLKVREIPLPESSRKKTPKRSPKPLPSTSLLMKPETMDITRACNLDGFSKGGMCGTMVLPETIEMPENPTPEDFETRMGLLKNQLQDFRVNQTFGFAPSITEVILGLYMYNTSKIIKDLCGIILEDVPMKLHSTITKCAAAHFCLFGALPQFDLEKREKELLLFEDHHQLKLMTFWGVPIKAENSSMDIGENVVFFSPNGTEGGLGGASQKNHTSVAHFDGHGGSSLVVITIPKDMAQEVELPKKVHVNDPINLDRANTKYHIITFPSITLESGLSQDELELVRVTSEEICKLLGIPIGSVHYLSGKHYQDAEVVLKNTSFNIAPKITIPLVKKRSFLMRHRSMMKYPQMLKLWAKAGGELDLQGKKTLPKLKKQVLSEGLQALKRGPAKGILNCTIGGQKLSEKGVIFSPQLATFLFGRNGTFAIKDRFGRLESRVLLDPPITTPEGKLIGLGSVGWPALNLQSMVDKEPKPTTKLSYKKLTIGQIQMFMAMKACGLTAQGESLINFIDINKVLKDEMKRFKSMGDSQEVYFTGKKWQSILPAKIELSIFANTCGGGVFTGDDALFFKMVQTLINPILSTGHGTGEITPVGPPPKILGAGTPPIPTPEPPPIKKPSKRSIKETSSEKGPSDDPPKKRGRKPKKTTSPSLPMEMVEELPTVVVTSPPSPPRAKTPSPIPSPKTLSDDEEEDDEEEEECSQNAPGDESLLAVNFLETMLQEPNAYNIFGEDDQKTPCASTPLIELGFEAMDSPTTSHMMDYMDEFNSKPNYIQSD